MTSQDIKAKSLLDSWRAGDMTARDQLFDMLYGELRKLSASLLNREGGISLTTGDLVNEAVIRLVNLNSIKWQDKAHFMALSSTMMRRVLIDHARSKNTDKRHHQKVTLITHSMGQPESVDIRNLENALLRLQAIDEDRARIVEMRYYGGMTLDDIAEVIGMSASSVKRSWRVSKAWLLSAMQNELPN